MIEIIVAVILQVTTILGGADTEQDLADKKAKEEKAKKEQTTETTGGTGNWETAGK